MEIPWGAMKTRYFSLANLASMHGMGTQLAQIVGVKVESLVALDARSFVKGQAVWKRRRI